MRPEKQMQYQVNPSLASALAITLRLIGIDFAHSFQQIARVRFRNIRRFWAATITLFRPPRNGLHWFLRPVRHAYILNCSGKNARRYTADLRCWEENDIFRIMIRHKLLITGVVVVVTLTIPVVSFAQEGKKKSNSTEAELSSLHKLVEDQSKQLEALTEQVAHLAQLLETQHAAASAATPTPAPIVRPASSPVQENPVATAAISGTGSPETPGTHIVTKGETLTSIAKHYKITLGDLLKVNKIENDRMLQIGQTLVIPTPAPADNPQEKKENQ